MTTRKVPKPYADAFRQAMADRNVRNVDIATMFEIDASYVTQWRKGDRPIPDNKAEALGRLLGVPPETISEPYRRKHIAQSLVEAGDTNSKGGTFDLSGHSRIERLSEFQAAEGPQHLILPTFLVRQKSGHTPIEHVRWLLNPSRAMDPEIPRGALVLLDSSVRTRDAVIDGDTYAYSLRGRPDIRRILIRKDHWSVAGHGKHSDLTDVYEADLQSLEIFGLVLGSF